MLWVQSCPFAINTIFWDWFKQCIVTAVSLSVFLVHTYIPMFLFHFFYSMKDIQIYFCDSRFSVLQKKCNELLWTRFLCEDNIFSNINITCIIANLNFTDVKITIETSIWMLLQKWFLERLNWRWTTHPTCSERWTAKLN